MRNWYRCGPDAFGGVGGLYSESDVVSLRSNLPDFFESGLGFGIKTMVSFALNK